MKQGWNELKSVMKVVENSCCTFGSGATNEEKERTSTAEEGLFAIEVQDSKSRMIVKLGLTELVFLTNMALLLR